MIKPDKTFCDVEHAEISNLENADVAIFSSSHGSPYKPGVPSHAANAPAAIRGALSWYSSNPNQFDLDTLKPVFGGKSVVDCGEIPGSLDNGEENRAAIADAARQILVSGVVPILIGGDDSTPVTFIEAIAEAGPVTVLQIDAHIDWREEVDGERFGFSSTMRRASEFPNVERIIQVGARGPGSARERDFEEAQSWGAKFITARMLHSDGLDQVLQEIPADGNIILAVDVDGLDPSVVPGVILPAFGGLSYNQMLEIIIRVSEKAHIIAANFVEYVPERDQTGIGAGAIARIICNAITASTPMSEK
jgi:agmatinase